MSVHVTSPIWRQVNLPPNRKIVLLHLADCANVHGANAFPGVARIALETGVSIRTTKEILAEFRTSGVLVVEGYARGGRGRATVYRIDLERVRALHPFPTDDDNKKGATAALFVQAEADQKGAIAAPFTRPERVRDDAQKGASRRAKGCESFAPLPSGTVKKNRQDPPIAPPVAGDQLAEAVRLWNELADRIGLAKVQHFSEARRQKLRRRLAECGGADGWRAALAKVEASAFLTGGGRGAWRADFDFMLQAKSFTKIFEGSYDDRPRRGGPRNEIADAFARMDAAAAKGRQP